MSDEKPNICDTEEVNQAISEMISEATEAYNSSIRANAEDGITNQEIADGFRAMANAETFPETLREKIEPIVQMMENIPSEPMTEEQAIQFLQDGFASQVPKILEGVNQIREQECQSL